MKGFVSIEKERGAWTQRTLPGILTEAGCNIRRIAGFAMVCRIQSEVSASYLFQLDP
jgi:hypothetical protein